MFYLSNNSTTYLQQSWIKIEILWKNIWDWLLYWLLQFWYCQVAVHRNRSDWFYCRTYKLIHDFTRTFWDRRPSGRWNMQIVLILFYSKGIWRITILIKSGRWQLLPWIWWMIKFLMLLLWEITIWEKIRTKEIPNCLITIFLMQNTVRWRISEVRLKKGKWIMYGILSKLPE